MDWRSSSVISSLLTFREKQRQGKSNPWKKYSSCLFLKKKKKGKGKNKDQNNNLSPHNFFICNFFKLMVKPFAGLHTLKSEYCLKICTNA